LTEGSLLPAGAAAAARSSSAVAVGGGAAAGCFGRGEATPLTAGDAGGEGAIWVLAGRED